MMDSFSETLRTMRTRSGLSNVELATRAHVPASLIAGLQSGKRCVGEFQATKIARALDLGEQDLRQFVLRAVSGSSRKVLAASADYSAEIINAAPSALRKARIAPDHVQWGWETEGGVALVLADGKRAILRTTLEEAA